MIWAGSIGSASDHARACLAFRHSFMRSGKERCAEGKSLPPPAARGPFRDFPSAQQSK